MMKTPLAACPACARHVRVDEPHCPFCRVELSAAFRAQTPPASPAKRLNRAALYALRMGAISMAATACGGSVKVIGDGGADDSSTAQDATGGGGSSGASGGGGSSGAIGSSSGGQGYDGPYGVAAYGGFTPFDAGGVEPPADAQAAPDADPADAKPDHIFIAPPYGIVPPYGGPGN
jgi:hypothetical protein